MIIASTREQFQIGQEGGLLEELNVLKRSAAVAAQKLRRRLLELSRAEDEKNFASGMETAADAVYTECGHHKSCMGCAEQSARTPSPAHTENCTSNTKCPIFRQSGRFVKLWWRLN
jgi:hypothetical protein